MEEYLHRVKKSPLFYGINDNELYTLLKCCAAEQVPYEDGEYIFRMGESVNKVLILLKGRARVIQENSVSYTHLTLRRDWGDWR